jgi:VWFA-related protein
VFLFLLGRGRMNGPSKEAEALATFVKERLMPQDQVAVLAYNRATDFTTDHATIAALVQRYRERHEHIEALLSQHFSGLRAVYGSKVIPPHIQAEIDAVFGRVPGLRPRSITPGQMADAKRITEDVQRTSEELQRAELLAGRTGEFAGLPDPAATTTAERLDVSFDDYISSQSELTHDLGNLYAGIDYMRYVEGEKHLAFITPRGLALPRMENNQVLAQVASDARIALDIIYTGGVVGAPPTRVVGGRVVMLPLPSVAQVFGQTLSVQDMRTISEMTGGQMSAFKYGRDALNRLDDATRFQYLLGYSPANDALDGKYRRVAVKVNRPGATVLYRRGYYATRQIIPLDRRQFITENRIAAAGSYAGIVEDIKVRLDKPRIESGKNELTVAFNIQSPRTRFVLTDGRHSASLEIAIFCVDSQQRIVGQLRQTMDLRLRDAAFQAFQAEGRSHSARVPLTGVPLFVKVVVYDYGADVTGSAAAKLR